ncbi:MAG: 50S ribosomal protein L24 [Euryarchaeota archaeon]|nr:50S ribosomal protein L24 [Euryarchaeota archaeon]
MSKLPRKQRKRLHQAPLHRRQKMVVSPLSAELREKYGKRSARVRRGDTVRMLRGDFAGHEGKVEKVILKTGKIHVAGVTIQKANATDRFLPVDPSNCEITKLELGDELRIKSLERK